MNSLTITFASREDHDQALKQMLKAQEYSYRDSQLGAIGLSLLSRTIERARAIESSNQTVKPNKRGKSK